MSIKRRFVLSYRIYAVIIFVLIAVITLAVWWYKQSGSRDSLAPGGLNAPSLINQSSLDKLATTSVPIDRSHLAEELTSPTNKWFSGFALQPEPKPGYNYPSSFLPKNSGFEFSLPKVKADKTIIAGQHSPDVVVKIDGSTTYKVTDYDELMVELTYYSQADQPLLTVRLASGLPYVYLNARQDVNLSFSGQASQQGSWTQIASNNSYYGVNLKSNNNRSKLNKGQMASFFSAPSAGSLKQVAARAGADLESTKVSYERQGDKLKTIFTYNTTNDQAVLFARLPHQQTKAKSNLIYQSILGDMSTETGNQFSFNTPAVPVTDKLDLSEISDQQRKLIADQLANDVADFQPKPDTYFGGKQLYRMAQLLIIADQLGEDKLADTAKTKLKQELEIWLSPGKNQPKSFLYEPSMQGIVGNEASFGADKEFNDHHFHYGYFIYASAVLAHYDRQFLSEHTDSVNLLVADIANYNSDEKLPLRRSFDPYAGHSWASGTSPFLDGNNQESTSEAITAWIGTALWAKQIDNQDLQLQADWMLAQEYQTARQYWLLQTELPEYLDRYSSPIVSIAWGGKREYSTFFSDQANAKLAIQLLPSSPTIKRLGQDLPRDIFAGTEVDQTYGDYILMNRPDATIEQAIDLPDSAIDDGNSRSYIYAYILSK